MKGSSIEMIRVLMVCLGNICRSPMAEFIFRDMAEKRGLGKEILVASAGTSDEEYGNPVYPPAQRKLRALGIDCRGKYARQMTRADYDQYDLLLGMENQPFFSSIIYIISRFAKNIKFT